MKLERFFSLGNSMDLSTRTAIVAAIKAGKRIKDNYHLLHQMENSPQIKREKLEQTWIKEEEDPRTISSITDTEKAPICWKIYRLKIIVNGKHLYPFLFIHKPD